jgi:hypothetical protein
MGRPGSTCSATSIPGRHGEELEVQVEIHGRLPGSVVLVTASGDYSNEAWYCGGGSDSETGVGALGSGPVSGSAEIETRITVGARGVGRATLRLAGDLPAETCPATSPYGPFPMQGRWTHVHVTLPEFGLGLTPPPYSWADTF